LAATFSEIGIDLLGVSLAFGLAVLTMAFAVGHISGCYLNPNIVSISPFFHHKNFVNIRTGLFFSQRVDCTFESTKKLNQDILVLLN